MYFLVTTMGSAGADTGAQPYLNNSIRVHSLPVSAENLPTAIPAPFVCESTASVENGDLRLDIVGHNGATTNSSSLLFTRSASGHFIYCYYKT